MSVSVMEGIQAQMRLDCVPDADECWCRGSGWILSDWDSWHKCYKHYVGQPNNESSETEWDIWLYNTNGDGQFMVIPHEAELISYGPHEGEWTNKITEEQSIESAWVRRIEVLRFNEGMETVPF